VAVRLLVPPGSEEVLNIALPEEIVPEPSRVTPLKKLTVPVGVKPGTATVAVSVTDWPNAEGFGVEARLVVVGAGFTTCISIAEVEPAKLAVPT